jgi:hypothetical protein
MEGGKVLQRRLLRSVFCGKHFNNWVYFRVRRYLLGFEIQKYFAFGVKLMVDQPRKVFV